MARAPDKRIEQAEAMYRKGMKLVEIASQLNLPEGTVRRWKCTHKWDNDRSKKKSERSERKGVLSRGTKTQLVPPEIRTLRSMGFSASISLKRPGRFFQPLNRQIPSIFFGIRFSLLMPLLSGHSELLTSKISKTKQSSALRRSLEM